ncbi:kinesin-associated protein 3 [Stylonychia lemnae]|uniref:Kinesin-associated protein 3 n=1 Tax=Stylonychia lemnae TaxID=5949 RepID=A0A078AJ58_STYLE|nr:kinesin-associated protein 3 [Stylonychia lemnae]|eukprot:CDW81512.1 kinesin-associated protein 3 [Stylonychia lemnae]
MAQPKRKAKVANIDYSKVSIQFIEQYVENFYEDAVEKKIEGAKCLLYLCFSHENMEFMLENETLFATMARTIRDDFRNSMNGYLLQVIINSKFQNQIGDTTIKIIEHEIKRYIVKVKEFKQKTEDLQAATGTPQYEEMAQILRKEERQLSLMIKRQEKVLFVAFHLLLNLAEDLQIERKMKNRSIIGLLVTMMDRNNPDLLFIVLNFLKKLSIFGDNKTEMKEQGIIEKINRFIPCNNQLLLQIALRLLFNLSFDEEIRMQMAEQGLIPKLVEILKAPGFRALILKLLYHLSLEDKTKATFTYTECIPLVYQLIIHCPEPIVGKELVGLAVNLATNTRNAERFAQDEQLEELINRAIKFNDTLLFKVCRNIAQFAPSTLETFERYLEQYIMMAQQCGENTDLQLELLGTMVYIHSDRWEEAVHKTNFIEFVYNSLLSGFAEDDIILETVMLVATICRNDDIATILANSFLIKMLQDLLGAKQEDDEMVQQILNTFFKFLFFKPTREIVLHQTQMVSIVLELLSDKNPNIRKLVNAILDHVQLHDEMWKQEIKTRRFQVHNQVYLKLMEEYDKQYPSQDGMYEYYYDDRIQGQGEGIPDDEDFDSDDALFFDNNDLANRIWEDND